MTLTAAASGAAVAPATRRYKDFPPGWGHIKVPLSSRAAALAGLGLYSPSLPRGLWLQRAARIWVEIFGPRTLPGATRPWTPVGEEEWTELADAWHRELGPFDEVAGYHRLQASRPGLALLLLRKGTPMAFVKLRRGNCPTLANERIALEAAWRYGPRAFQVPEPLGSGSAAGWRYLAVAPLPGGLHRPPRDPPLAPILEDIAGALADHPRPANAPEHWRPMHGDFAPWNLRQLQGRLLVLIDWENAAWAPPGADEVFYRATRGALWHESVDRCEQQEAVQFWRARLPAEPETARDQRLANALKVVLGHMAGS